MYGIYVFRRDNIAASLLIPILAISILTIGIPLTTSQNIMQMTSSFAKLSPMLIDKITTQGNAPINVLIETYTSDYSSVVMDINSLGGKVGYQYKYIDALSAVIPADKIIQLASNENVARIYYDAEQTLSDISSSKYLVTDDKDAIDLDSLIENPIGFEGEFETISVAPEQIALEPANYWNPVAMNAYDVWDLGYFGQGSMVVIIDSGIWTGHFMFGSTSVVGGKDMSDDVDDPTYEGWNNPLNSPHGSHVAGILASTGGIIVPPTDPLAIAIELYTGTPLPDGGPYGWPGFKVIWLLGMAPATDLYIIKVFDHTGAGVPYSYVYAAIEHAINLKITGVYDIDAISMSLGGPTMYDGRALQDKIVDTATSVGITVVAATGNEGPALMTSGSPASANTAITVGAAANPVNTRVFWDYYCYVNFGFPPGSGIGYYLYTSNNPQIHALSSRGTTTDGRLRPHIAATGIYVLSAYIPLGVGGLAWFSGTSMATPAVSGAVALLNSYAEMNIPEASPEDYRQAIMNGAIWLSEYDEYDQGAGYLNAGYALYALIEDTSYGDLAQALPKKGEMPDITTIPIVGSGVFTAEINDLEPGRNLDFVFEITRATDSVRLDITNVEGMDLGPYLGQNSFEVYIQSAKRTTYDYYIENANVWGDASFLITDDATTWSGSVAGAYWLSHTIEPGYMKIVIENDWTCHSDISCDIRIEVTEEVIIPDITMKGRIKADEFVGWIPISVPPDTEKAIVELGWEHDWSAYPAIDLDMYIYWYDGTAWKLNVEGATWNGLERVVLDKPIGLYVAIYGYPSDPHYGLSWWKPEPYTLTIQFTA